MPKVQIAGNSLSTVIPFDIVRILNLKPKDKVRFVYYKGSIIFSKVQEYG